MNQTPILVAENVHHTVSGPGGPLTLLDGISLTVAEGETLAITGPSGSGKSTLLGLLAGLDQPSGGTISLAGAPFSALDEDGRAQRRGQLCGFVFQAFHLISDLTALENVALPLELQQRDDAREQAAQWLDKVGLGERMAHFPGQLSGGEQQRVALARAFAVAPRLLFADEPTGSLDHANGTHISDLLFELNRASGTALVLVTHDPALAQRCQSHLQLEAGRLHD
ncbi:MAG: ABC transporter ATP-binding protein [Alcanivoracaceae bacterium]|jgi:putative ABC transport system ATP-binding protein|nr:ABC transporter ATP-binding protein [Alcanivoracaceae bacterium]